MRKILAILTLAVASLSVAAPAGAGVLPQQAHVRGASIQEWQRRYVDWLTTSSENVLFNGGCGEVVHGVYFPPASSLPNQVVTCDVRPGVPILVSPAGTFSEIPTWGANDEAVQADAEATFDLLVSSSAEIDGRSVNLNGTTSSVGAYDVGPVEEGSFFDVECEALQPPCQVDFEPGETVRLASVAQVMIITPLRPGTHTIETTTDFGFFTASSTLTLQVG